MSEGYGYWVAYGYRGLVGDRWMIFASEDEYLEYLKEWQAWQTW